MGLPSWLPLTDYIRALFFAAISTGALSGVAVQHFVRTADDDHNPLYRRQGPMLLAVNQAGQSSAC